MTKPRKQMYLHASADGTPPRIKRGYDAAFRVTPAYRASLPDMMEAAHDAIQGAHVPIQQVGVSNFRLPLKFRTRQGEILTLEASITGTVSLEAELKGINMSRIVRVVLRRGGRPSSPARAWAGSSSPTCAGSTARTPGSGSSFSYPMVQPSLRSGLSGYQYYRVAFEGVMSRAGQYRRLIHFDFVYSSACPCSAELSEHARDKRGVYAIPHSQRSKARVTIEEAEGRKIWIEDIQEHCARALRTETQVMVKREDEQAFAEFNGAHVKFVEDAARLLYREFDADRGSRTSRSRAPTWSRCTRTTPSA